MVSVCPETSNSLTPLFVDKQSVIEWFSFEQVTGDAKGRISGNFGEFRIKSMKSVGDQELLNMLKHFSIWEEQRRVPSKTRVGKTNSVIRDLQFLRYNSITARWKSGQSEQTKMTASAESNERNEWPCHYLLLHNVNIPANSSKVSPHRTPSS